MSDVPEILHEEDVREVIDDEIQEVLGSDVVLNDPSSPTETYDTSFQSQLVLSIQAINQVLRDAGLVSSTVGEYGG